MAFYDDCPFDKGCNELSDEEKLLITEYTRSGRADLAACVENGRLYQRLRCVIAYDHRYPDAWILGWFNGLDNAFLGEKAGTPARSLDEWRTRTKIALKDDERWLRYQSTLKDDPQPDAGEDQQPVEEVEKHDESAQAYISPDPISTPQTTDNAAWNTERNSRRTASDTSADWSPETLADIFRENWLAASPEIVTTVRDVAESPSETSETGDKA